MKKIGTYTVRDTMGLSTTSIGGDRQRITLFDGRFDTGYVIREFKIWALDGECHATLSTVDEGTASTAGDYMMDAGDNTQIAWASSPASGSGPLNDGIVDTDNLVIEDLFVRGYATSASQPWNYLIVMDKYELSDWRGALAMVRNRAQGSDPQ
jgi:hypothetical protein